MLRSFPIPVQCSQEVCQSWWTTQELCFGFWENVAALLLQPDLSDGLQPYLDLALGLHKAGKA